MRFPSLIAEATLLVVATLTTYIDPTGTYKYVGKTTVKNGEAYGYTGGIQVKKLSSDRIVITFQVNKGAPSYNSGAFIDTLMYQDNKAVYTDVEEDSTCKITFDFRKNGIYVDEKTADYNSGCGFGHAVIAKGFFKKISSKMPVLTNPFTGEKLEE